VFGKGKGLLVMAGQKLLLPPAAKKGLTALLTSSSALGFVVPELDAPSRGLFSLLAPADCATPGQKYKVSYPQHIYVEQANSDQWAHHIPQTQ
jgi:hypothetical protein